MAKDAKFAKLIATHPIKQTFACEQECEVLTTGDLGNLDREGATLGVLQKLLTTVRILVLQVLMAKPQLAKGIIAPNVELRVHFLLGLLHT